MKPPPKPPTKAQSRYVAIIEAHFGPLAGWKRAIERREKRKGKVVGIKYDDSKNHGPE